MLLFIIDLSYGFRSPLLFTFALLFMKMFRILIIFSSSLATKEIPIVHFSLQCGENNGKAGLINARRLELCMTPESLNRRYQASNDTQED